MTRMSKSKRVLVLAEEQPFDYDKVYEQRDEDNTAIVTTQLTIDLADWEDFGQPETITVTVEPGDKLNEDLPSAHAPGQQVDEATSVPDQPGEPHSRACGWRIHPHGNACHSNCPTCGGREIRRG